MTTPDYTDYNYVQDGNGQWHEVPATIEPQSFDVKAGQAAAYLSAMEAKALEANATVPPPIQVTEIDGVPTIIARGALTGAAGTGTRVPDEDLDDLGIDRDVFPQCEYPNCKGEGRNRIFSGAGKPLSINRQGQLVFGELEPMPFAGMSANDKSRAAAGIAGIVGPSGIMGRQEPKCFVFVCHAHEVLPFAPRKTAPKRYRSGPYASYFAASHRAQGVGMRTRQEPRVYPVKTDGAEAWYVEGDDGHHGFQGTLVRL